MAAAWDVPLAPVKRLLQDGSNGLRVSEGAGRLTVHLVSQMCKHIGTKVLELVFGQRKSTITTKDLLFVVDRYLQCMGLNRSKLVLQEHPKYVVSSKEPRGLPVKRVVECLTGSSLEKAHELPRRARITKHAKYALTKLINEFVRNVGNGAGSYAVVAGRNTIKEIDVKAYSVYGLKL